MLDFTTPSDKPDFKLPFTEQIEFMRQKLNIPSNRWDDIVHDQHDAGFIVAGAAKWDLLADLRAAVQIAIEQGKSIGWFRKEFDNITANRGWVGFTGDGSKAGRAWRTRVIYQTNAATSYSAGRYAQIYDPEMLKRRPFLIYRHHTFEHPRLSHKSWNGLCLRADDPSWGWRYPPNVLVVIARSIPPVIAIWCAWVKPALIRRRPGLGLA
ncbi:MAG: phage minor head protein [Alphaproteobacteria bacterium]|nr:phage minor head protein [Alphaproteobacteria bacterium]